MDDASSIGGGNVVVGRMTRTWRQSGDCRASISVTACRPTTRFKLPFGPNRRWLNRESWAAHVFGGWLWNGSGQLLLGTPYTARILGSSSGRGARHVPGRCAPTTTASRSVSTIHRSGSSSIPQPSRCRRPGMLATPRETRLPGPSSTNVNMTLMKNFFARQHPNVVGAGARKQCLQHGAVRGHRQPSVNSPTFGRVVSMRSMRTVQLVGRVGF